MILTKKKVLFKKSLVGITKTALSFLRFSLSSSKKRLGKHLIASISFTTQIYERKGNEDINIKFLILVSIVGYLKAKPIKFQTYEIF